MSTRGAFSEIVEFDRIDDRVAIINTAFDLLIGMNLGFVEFCPNQNPPSRAEMIALAWLVNPTANRPLVEDGADPYFVELVRDLYDHQPGQHNSPVTPEEEEADRAFLLAVGKLKWRSNVGLFLQVKSGGHTHEFNIDTNAVAGVFAAADGDPQLRNAVRLVFGTGVPDEKWKTTAGTISTAISEVQQAISNGLSTCTYSIYGTHAPGVPASSASSVSGILIEGKQHRIVGGVDHCVLEQRELSADGTKVITVSSKDVRHLSRIHTENVGDLLIRKRKKPGSVLRLLRELEKAMSAVPPDSIVELMVG